MQEQRAKCDSKTFTESAWMKHSLPKTIQALFFRFLKGYRSLAVRDYDTLDVN